VYGEPLQKVRVHLLNGERKVVYRVLVGKSDGKKPTH
jgi:hypothetical protein